MRAAYLAPIVLVLLSACGDGGTSTDGSAADTRTKPVVYAVNYPLAYFAERMAGDAVDVVLPVPPGEDPAWWQPGDDAIRGFQKADLILRNGATYAKWMDKVSLPTSRQLDTSKSKAGDYLEMKEVTTHSHGPEGEHAHEGTAFTTWLDPAFAIAQADATRAALIRIAPGAEARIEQAHASLVQELSTLDEKLKQAVARAPERPVVFSHPVYQYLARAAGMNARTVHWEPDVMPGVIQWKRFEKLLEEHPATWMIWEAEPTERIRAKLAEHGVQSVVFSPCANRPASGDYMSVMTDNVSALETAYGG